MASLTLSVYLPMIICEPAPAVLMIGSKNRPWLATEEEEVSIKGVSLMLKSPCLSILRLKVNWSIRSGSEVFGGRCMSSEKSAWFT